MVNAKCWLIKGGPLQPRPQVPYGSRPKAAVPRRTQGETQTPKAASARLNVTDGDTFGWKAGDKATHKKWGVGMVVSVKGDGDSVELDIAFPEPIGIKRLLAKFAPIEKA